MQIMCIFFPPSLSQVLLNNSLLKIQSMFHKFNSTLVIIILDATFIYSYRLEQKYPLFYSPFFHTVILS